MVSWNREEDTDMKFKKSVSLLIMSIVICCGMMMAGCSSEDADVSDVSFYKEASPEMPTIPEVCENTEFDAWYDLALDYCAEKIVHLFAPNYETVAYHWESNFRDDRFLQEDGTIGGYEYHDEENYGRLTTERPYFKIVFENGAELKCLLYRIDSKPRDAAEYDEFTGELLNPIEYEDLEICFGTGMKRTSPEGVTETYDMFDSSTSHLFFGDNHFFFDCDIEGDRHVYTRGEVRRLVCGCGAE